MWTCCLRGKRIMYSGRGWLHRLSQAAYIPSSVTIDDVSIIDSKATKEAEREEAFELITNNPLITWGVSIISPEEIDTINILEASMLGMKRATDQVLDKLCGMHEASARTGSKTSKSAKSAPTKAQPLYKHSDFIALVDGNHSPKNMRVCTVPVIKGDATVYSIAAASIIAKVTRDRLMIELDARHPQYNIKQHKGYPTFEHRSLLHKYGPCSIYRFSYRPVRDASVLHGYPLPSYLSLRDPDEKKSAASKKNSIKVIHQAESETTVTTASSAGSCTQITADVVSTNIIGDRVKEDGVLTRGRLRSAAETEKDVVLHTSAKKRKRNL
jgi:ribonuclease HII